MTATDGRSLRDRILLITGASRGIGLAIARAAARDAARVAIVAKTQEPHPTLPGTIYTAAEAVEKAGGTALPIAADIRFEEQIEAAVAKTVQTFGGIDILVNNASAIHLLRTESLPTKRFDLMQQVNARATFLCARHCLAHLRKSENPHVLTLAPPISLKEKWFARHAGYTVSKFSMAMITFGLAAEFREEGIAFNCLWPQTVIRTAALAMIPGINASQCRTPEIVADAAHAILTRPARQFSGNFCIDEAILREEGRTDFARYRVETRGELLTDLFLE
jgi:citronellol/citronellal dehydrogenase